MAGTCTCTENAHTERWLAGARPRDRWGSSTAWKYQDVSIQVIALIAAALLAMAAAFQVGLAAGAPWGAAAYGGRVIVGAGALPRRYRLGSGVAVLMLLGAMWVVLASVSVVGRGPVSPGLLTIILWCLTGLFGLNTLGNARARHPLERWVAGSGTALLAILCGLIAAN